MDKSTIFSVSDLTKLVEGGFRELFDEFLFWCKAEIGSMKKYGTRWYIDLFEYGPYGKVKAKITGIIWQDSTLQAFLKQTGNTIETIKGKELMIQGYLSFSAQYGLSVSIMGFSKEFEIGKQVENIEAIRTSLRKSGLYSKNKEKKLSLLPKNFALVSSSQSEGLKDFLTILSDSGYPLSYTLFESPIDGDKAIKGVVKAFDAIHDSGVAFDVVILLRGGGGKEGFSWQNTVEVTSAVAMCSFPVCLAIGHTSDESLLDEISWKAMKTPSDAARFFVDTRQTLQTDVLRFYQSTQTALDTYFIKYKDLQEFYWQSIQSLSKQRISWYKEHINTYFTTIITYSPSALLNKGYSLIKRHGKYIKITDQQTLKVGDSIEIESKNTIIKAKIEEINSF